MATSNPFDLLGDDDNDDPSQLLAAAQQQKIAAKKAAAAAPPAAPASAKLPSKPLPPSQAVKEGKGNAVPGRGSGAGRGGGRGRGMRGGRGGGPNMDFDSGNPNGFSSSGYAARGGEEGDAGGRVDRDHGEQGNLSGPRQPYRGGGGRGGRNGGDYGDFDRPRRTYEHHSGTGRGYEMKREGAGRGNWGTTNDTIPQEAEENVIVDKVDVEQKGVTSPEANKDDDGAANEGDKKEEEDKVMTLEEYEKIREEKRKALLTMKTEERKVEKDKDFESMKQLSQKKGNDDVFVKLGGDKESGKRRIVLRKKSGLRSL